jgi:hypothetical protein
LTIVVGVNVYEPGSYEPAPRVDFVPSSALYAADLDDLASTDRNISLEWLSSPAIRDSSPANHSIEFCLHFVQPESMAQA